MADAIYYTKKNSYARKSYDSLWDPIQSNLVIQSSDMAKVEKFHFLTN